MEVNIKINLIIKRIEVNMTLLLMILAAGSVFMGGLTNAIMS
jgi:hypothetical protein